MSFDFALALRNFYARKAANKGKQIDNASLYAGSPMHYYCRFCGEHTETLPESHMSRPKTICDPCKVLNDHGVLTREVLDAEALPKKDEKPFEHPLLRSLREEG